MVGQLNESSFVDSQNRRWTRFHQYADSVLGLLAQAPVAQHFGGQESAAAECQGFETLTNMGVRWI